MKTRSLLILVAVAGLAGAAALIASRAKGPEGVTPAGAEPRLFPDLEARINDAAAVEIRAGKNTMKLVRGPADWLVESRDGYPADFEKIKTLIVGLSKSAVTETKTSNPALYGKIGVDDPDKDGATSSLITVKDSAGQTLAGVIIGNRAAVVGNPMGGDRGVFVRRAGQPESFLVKDLPAADTALMSWIKPEILKIEAARFRSATVTQAGVAATTPESGPPAPDGTPNAAPPSLAAPPIEEVRVEKDANGQFVLANMPAGRELKDPNPLASIGGVLAFVGMDDVAKAGSVFGADSAKAANSATLVYRTSDGLEITANLLDKEGKSWVAFSAKALPTIPAAAIAAPAAADGQTPAAPETKSAESKTDQSKPTDNKPAEPAPDPKIIAEAETLNKRLAGWAFAIPSFKAQQMRPRLQELIKDPNAPAPESQPGMPPGMPPAMFPGNGDVAPPPPR